MFKIVQTLEKGQKELTVIPAGWEKEGILFWPKYRADKLIKQLNSLPEANWFKLDCKLKRSHLPDINVAEEELARMLENDDTEQDDTCASSYPSTTKRSPLETSVPVDLNDVAESCVEIDIENVPQNDLPESFIIYQNGVPEVELVSDQTEHQNAQLQATLSTIIENQTKMMYQLSKLQVMFDELVNNETAKYSCACNHENRKVLINEPIDPIETIEDLETFEDKLKDLKVFQNYVEKLSFICGKSGKGKGLDVSYMLVDKIFHRKFMLLCSWAGGSKDKKEKYPFKFYKHVIRLFFEVVHLADNAYT